MAQTTYESGTERSNYSMIRRTFNSSTGALISTTPVNYTDVPYNEFNRVGEKRSFPTAPIPPHSPYTRTFHRKAFRPIDRRVVQNSNGITTEIVQGTWPGLLLTGLNHPLSEFSSGEKSAIVIDATNKFLESRIDLGVELAELPKTISLVTSTAGAIYESYRAARKGKFHRALDILGDVNRSRRPNLDRMSTHQKWLAVQYGWTPLMLGVQDACSVMSDGLGNWRFSANVFRGSRKMNETSVVKYSNLDYEVTTKARGLSCRLDFRIKSELARTFNQLGLLNPASTAWELVPLSFVADWFIPIGDWLSSMSSFAVSEFITGSRTEIYERKVKLLNSSYVTGGQTVHVTNMSAPSSSHEFKLVRSLVTSAVPPWPPLDLSLSSTRMVSACALLRGMTKGR